MWNISPLPISSLDEATVKSRGQNVPRGQRQSLLMNLESAVSVTVIQDSLGEHRGGCRQKKTIIINCS